MLVRTIKATGEQQKLLSADLSTVGLLTAWTLPSTANN